MTDRVEPTGRGHVPADGGLGWPGVPADGTGLGWPGDLAAGSPDA